MTDITEMFRARCEARALLWQAGQLHLHEAVDALQFAAEKSDLVGEIGQDAVQAIMSAAWDRVSVWQPAQIADKPKPRGTARATLDAAAWLWFQKSDVSEFRAFLDGHLMIERQDILDHIRAIKARRDANQR